MPQENINYDISFNLDSSNCMPYNTLRESIEVLRGKKQKLDCIFEQ